MSDFDPKRIIIIIGTFFLIAFLLRGCGGYYSPYYHSGPGFFSGLFMGSMLGGGRGYSSSRSHRSSSRGGGFKFGK